MDPARPARPAAGRAPRRGLATLGIGGGLGIVYADEKPPSIAEFMAVVARETDGLGCELTFEPGRRLVGEAGVLVGVSGVFWTVGFAVGAGSRLAWRMRRSTEPPKRLG